MKAKNIEQSIWRNMGKPELISKLNQISSEASDCTLLDSDYGQIEAWNLVTCYIQNAESEGNDLITHIECSISTESKSVRDYFAKLGIRP